jgi:COP9 signalosome complex subunit 2
MKSLRTINEKMWIGITMRACKAFLEKNDLENMEKTLMQLRSLVVKPDGKYDDKKINVFDYLALEIKLASRSKDIIKMRKLYSDTQKNMSEGLSDPRTLSIIQETGARIQLIEKNWERARILFFDAFKNYQEIASPDAKRMLQFDVIASILSYSTINPLFSQEGRVFAETPEFTKLDQFRKAFDNNDIPTLLSLCSDKTFIINSDNEFTPYKNDIMRNVRLKVIVSFVQPYDTIQLSFMAKELNVKVEELIVLLTDLILENKLNGKIDEISGVLNLKPESVDADVVKQRKLIERIGSSLHRMMDVKYSSVMKAEY